MQRREFFMAAGAVAAPLATRKAEVGTRNWGPDELFRVPRSTFRVDQEPSFSPEVFARRLERPGRAQDARARSPHRDA